MTKKKYVLQFSGGRDSIALLLLWEPYKADTVVLTVDAGGLLPEVKELIAKLTEGWDTRMVYTDSAAWIKQNGIPSDVVPIWHSTVGRVLAGNIFTAPIISALTCCTENIMRPMQEASLLLGATTIVRGQRNAEDKKSPVRSGMVLDGIEYLFPLENWSDSDVNAFLTEHGITLPEWYLNGRKGFDCWWCTGYAKESKGLHQYLEQHYPEKYGVVRARRQLIQQLVMEEL